ncbi:hypothetical protein [Maribacter stanieri]|uniref:hypothetical protein n=1 Tax=Maribacter stanieri TaxID=440514 RepID=UPI0024956C34|nr:hypothetical protein [Maribacter stanieri]
MKTSLFFIASLFLLLYAYGESKTLNFERDGISLTTPKEWEITEQENKDDQGYLSIEKDGFDSSGFITMTWLTVK